MVSILDFYAQSCRHHRIILLKLLAISTALHNCDCSPILPYKNNTIGFNLSHWLTLPGMYSPHMIAVAAIVGGCDEKNEP